MPRKHIKKAIYDADMLSYDCLSYADVNKFLNGEKITTIKSGWYPIDDCTIVIHNNNSYSENYYTKKTYYEDKRPSLLLISKEVFIKYINTTFRSHKIEKLLRLCKGH
jgi:hypothetical protein